MKDHIFICYVREDEAFVLSLARQLKDHNISIWLDRWNIPVGADWDQSIDAAIYDCAQFLIVLSPEAVASTEVRGELRTALDEKKPIIPVLYKACRVPRQLLTVQMANFTNRGPDDEVALTDLLRTLETGTATVPQAEDPPEERDRPSPPMSNSSPEETDPPDPPYWTLPYGEPRWITIPAGEFWMGSDENDSNADADEKPLHKVFVSEVCIAPTPVTNEQYQLYVQATGAEPPRHWENGRPPQDKLDHPVANVSWEDAQQYCQWLSKETGKAIRLPTEAEWEKAARGDQDKRIYPWGDEFDKAKCNTEEADIGGTSAVGRFPEGASPYGCLDMSGNVWEWTQDWFSEVYYQHSPEKDPQGPDDGDYRSVRGGSWWYDLRGARVAYRYGGTPGDVYDSIGFRCASR